ncbi:MAG: ATP-dependent DNA helicase RecQ [Bacteroidota bacterium]
MRSWRRALQVLLNHWGYAAFRPAQEPVVRAVLEGRDVLAVLPTGGGKSVCYQVPAVAQDGLTLVVSPLIALMQDQVTALEARGISAAYINSTLSAREVEQRWTDAEFGRYRLLYVAPERLESEVFLARAERLPVTLLAVDEAHCISEWGPHFRPSYLRLVAARARLGHPPTLAVTATATPEVRQDIARHLALRDPAVLVHGFDRPNLVWSLFHTTNKRERVQAVLDGVPGSGVIYVATRRGAEQWAAWLEARGVSAAAYHGGLEAAQRAETQEAWLAGTPRVMVATNAFGMGIDKPDVRFVIHAEMPATLEAYYQEAGRGGRDGQRAHAVLLFSPGDAETRRTMLEEAHPTAAQVRQVYEVASSLAQVAVAAQPDGPVQVDVHAVAQVARLRVGLVRSAVEVLIRQGTWQRMPVRRYQGLLRFDQSAEAVRRFAEGLDNPSLRRFVDAVLRAVHAEAYAGWWDLDLRLLTRRTGLPTERLSRGLAFLQSQGLLRWRPPTDTLVVHYAEPRAQQVPVDGRVLRQARRRAERQLRHMERYVAGVTCRRAYLLHYFGEDATVPCGACDVCLGRHEPPVITAADEPALRDLMEAIRTGEDALTPRPEHLAWLAARGYAEPTDVVGGTWALTALGERLLDR